MSLYNNSSHLLRRSLDEVFEARPTASRLHSVGDLDGIRRSPPLRYRLCSPLTLSLGHICLYLFCAFLPDRLIPRASLSRWHSYPSSVATGGNTRARSLLFLVDLLAPWRWASRARRCAWELFLFFSRGKWIEMEHSVGISLFFVISSCSSGWRIAWDGKEVRPRNMRWCHLPVPVLALLYCTVLLLTATSALCMR